MPEGTRVHDCVDKLKGQGKETGSAIAICQSSTGQGFASGKPLHKSIKNQSLRCSKFLRPKCSCKSCSHHV